MNIVKSAINKKQNKTKSKKDQKSRINFTKNLVIDPLACVILIWIVDNLYWNLVVQSILEFINT